MIDFAERNKNVLKKIKFALSERNNPTVVFFETATKNQFHIISAHLKTQLPDYQHIKIDISNEKVGNIHKLINEKSPEIFDNTQINHIIHIWGLANHLFDFVEGKIQPSDLTQIINLQRESIFRNIPAIIIFYLDAYSIERLQKFAPDFWDWVTYYFSFDFTQPEISEKQNSEFVLFSGNDNFTPVDEKKINKDIKYLTEFLNNLSINDYDEETFYRKKIDYLKELASLNEKLRNYKTAQKQLKEAYYLAKKLKSDNEKVANIMFLLANVHYRLNDFTKAEEYYEEALQIYRDLAQENFRTYLPDVAMTLNNLATLHYAKNEFSEALAKYEEALQIRRDLAKENPQTFLPDVAMTLNNLAVLYTARQNFSVAYDLALVANEIARKFPDLATMQKVYFYTQEIIDAFTDNTN